MSKKRFSGIMLASILTLGGIATTLTSCGEEGGNTVNPTPTPDEVVINKITIDKETMNKPFHIGDDDRDVVCTLDPVANFKDLVSKKKIQITSSNPDIVAVQGVKLKALKEGKSTITVSFSDTVKDSVEITILPKEEAVVKSVKDTLVEAATECPNGKDTTAKEFKVKGKIIANDFNVEGKAQQSTKQNIVVADGTAAVNIYITSADLTCDLKAGTPVTVTGKLTNYYGAIQFANPVIEASKEEVQSLQPQNFTVKDFNDFYNLANKNNNGIKDNQPTESKYIKADFKLITESKFEIVGEGLTKKTVSFSKTNETMLNKIKAEVGVGDVISATGVIIGYNTATKFDYFNFIVEGFEKKTEAIQPTSIKISVSKTNLKVRENVTIEHSFEPAGANGKVTYSITEGKEFAVLKGNKLIATKEGTVKVQATVEGLATPSNVLTFTIAGVADDAISKAEVKTIEEVKKMPTDATKLYKVKGIVVKVDAGDKYGNITIKDETGNELSAYGTAGDFTCWDMKADGTIGFENPKNFNKVVLNKLFKLGDEVEFYVLPYDFKGKPNYNFQFNQKTRDASEFTYSLTITDEHKIITADKKEGLKIGDTVTLTVDSSKIPANKNLAIKYNGKALKANEKGQYTFVVTPVNEVSVELFDKPQAGGTFLINSDILGTTNSYSDSTSPIDIGNGYTIKYTQLYRGDNDCIQLNKKKESMIWFETAGDFNIESITITASKSWSSDGKAKCVCGAKFGTENVSKNFIDSEDVVENLNGNATYTFTNKVAGAKYFALRSFAGPLYLSNISIKFAK